MQAIRKVLVAVCVLGLLVGAGIWLGSTEDGAAIREFEQIKAAILLLAGVVAGVGAAVLHELRKGGK